MKLLHVSDNHSLFIDYWSLMGIDPSTIDAVVHSGDFCPNWSRGIRPIEVPRQEQWLIENAENIRHWTRDKPILFVHGNHDFLRVDAVLGRLGVNIIALDGEDLDGKIYITDFKGIKFAGYNLVPWFTGEWNNEVQEHVEEYRIKQIIALKPDVIVSHCPIKGVLDRNQDGDRCGSRQLAILLKEEINNGWQPKAFLHGHIHEPGGAIVQWKNMIISNAATTARVIEL